MNNNQQERTGHETRLMRFRIRGLKIVMIGGGGLETLIGIVCIFAPAKLSALMGHGGTAIGASYLSLFGVCITIPSIFIMLAGRDPLQYFSWVRFATVWAVASVIILILSIIRDFATFSEIGGNLVLDFLFAVVYLALYPWGIKSSRISR